MCDESCASRTPRRSAQMLGVFLILITDVFHQLVFGQQDVGADDRKWPSISARIVDRDLFRQCPECCSAIPLYGMELFGMRVAKEIEPGPVVEPGSVHDQDIAFSPTDRMPIPCRVQIQGMFAAVHEYLAEAVDVSFKHEEHVRGCFDDPPRIRSQARHSRWQAVRFRVILGQPGLQTPLASRIQWERLPLLESQRNVLNQDNVSRTPDSGKVYASIGEPGSWSGRRRGQG